MAMIRNFRELHVYQAARQQAQEIYEITKTFPKSEMYSLTDQIRRSSRAVGAIIAEGWSRRRYEAAFVNKMSEAMAEANETQSWLDFALDCNYVNQETHKQLDDRMQHIGAMLNKMIERSSDFCSATKPK